MVNRRISKLSTSKIYKLVDPIYHQLVKLRISIRNLTDWWIIGKHKILLVKTKPTMYHFVNHRNARNCGYTTSNWMIRSLLSLRVAVFGVVVVIDSGGITHGNNDVCLPCLCDDSTRAWSVRLFPRLRWLRPVESSLSVAASGLMSTCVSASSVVCFLFFFVSCVVLDRVID